MCTLPSRLVGPSPVVLEEFFIPSPTPIIISLLGVVCCQLCYVYMPQINLAPCIDNSISCLNITYLLPFFIFSPCLQHCFGFWSPVMELGIVIVNNF